MTGLPDLPGLSETQDARIVLNSLRDAPDIEVMFNPNELTITTNMLYPDISVPGLKVPLTQFVRGQARTLSVELFLDQSMSGESLGRHLGTLRDVVKVNGDLHAPPVVTFAWGDTEFTGVVFEFQEKFAMFDKDGQILRARVTLKMKSFEPSNLQYTEINPRSPDRTKTRAARAGDRYDLIAAEEYGNPALWPVLADANGDERPRLLSPGDLIVVPTL